MLAASVSMSWNAFVFSLKLRRENGERKSPCTAVGSTSVATKLSSRATSSESGTVVSPVSSTWRALSSSSASSSSIGGRWTEGRLELIPVASACTSMRSGSCGTG